MSCEVVTQQIRQDYFVCKNAICPDVVVGTMIGIIFFLYVIGI